MSTIIERDEESVEKASFEGRRKPSTVRSRVRSIVFCSVKRRNVDRARFLLEGENERRRIFLSALSSPFPRGDEGREERERAERARGDNERGLRERSFYWGGCSCGSQGPAIVSWLANSIYTRLSLLGREKPRGRV